MLELLPLTESEATQERARTWGQDFPGQAVWVLWSPPVIDDDATLIAQLLLAAARAGLDEPTDLCDFAVDALDAEALLHRVPAPMSRGERQICGLLLMLAAPCDALFAIDPTAGLDLARRKAVRSLLEDCASLPSQPHVMCVSDDPIFQ